MLKLGYSAGQLPLAVADVGDPRQQILALYRQARFPVIAYDQLHAHFLFQGRDHAADARLRVAKIVSRLRETAGLGNAQQGLVFRVHHTMLLCGMQRFSRAAAMISRRDDADGLSARASPAGLDDKRLGEAPSN